VSMGEMASNRLHAHEGQPTSKAGSSPTYCSAWRSKMWTLPGATRAAQRLSGLIMTCCAAGCSAAAALLAGGSAAGASCTASAKVATTCTAWQQTPPLSPPSTGVHGKRV
jgi:hypothetical protein